jgi:arylsulfatase
MNRRQFLQTGSAALLADRPRPNILLFCTDQQRSDTISALGNTHIRTPNMDRLVRDGTVFTNAYCQTPICTPSRASFLTGCYASSLHVNRNGNEYFPAQFTSRLLPRILKSAGYDCGLVGKFHLSSAAKRVEPRIDDGYRLFEWSHAPRPDWPVEQNGYLRWLRNKGTTFQKQYRSRRLPNYPAEFNAGMPAQYHESMWCADTAAQWIRGGMRGPWFINVNTYAPHPPFDPPGEFLERIDPNAIPAPHWRASDAENQANLAKVDFQSKHRDPAAYPSRALRACYYAQVEFVDHCLGLVLDALQSTGQASNTLIVFTSDHGEALGDHGLIHKGCRFYEGLSHVPLMFALPGVVQAGRRSEGLVELTDIVPTILELAGLPRPDYLHGRSVLPILNGQKAGDAHREFVRAEYHDVLDLPDGTHANMIRDPRYKLVRYHGHPGELYDLAEDPMEFRNLFDDPGHAKVRAQMADRLFDAVMLTTDPGQPRIAGS